MAKKILFRTGIEADAGVLDAREPGFTSDSLRVCIGDGAAAKFLTSEALVSIATAAPAALAQMEHTRTSIICDTDTAAASIALDIKNGALVSPSVCYVHSVGATTTRYVMVQYKAGYYRKVFVGSTCEFFWNGTEWFCPQPAEVEIGKIVGGGLYYVSSNLVKLRPIGYHINNGVQDFWIRIDAETSLTNATANWPGAGTWAYVLGDKDGNITLATATGAAGVRPSDAYYQWGEIGGTGFNHYKKGYYLDATHRILGAIHQVSATSFYFIHQKNETDEEGQNSNGSWIRVNNTQRAITENAAATNPVTAIGALYYTTAAVTFPVPFLDTTYKAHTYTRYDSGISFTGPTSIVTSSTVSTSVLSTNNTYSGFLGAFGWGKWHS